MARPPRERQFVEKGDNDKSSQGTRLSQDLEFPSLVSYLDKFYSLAYINDVYNSDTPFTLARTTLQSKVFVNFSVPRVHLQSAVSKPPAAYLGSNSTVFLPHQRDQERALWYSTFAP